MGKTKVFELAKKLGVENNVLLERLQQAGVDAKSHQSVLEESDVKKFEAASQSTKKVEEERINPGIIRRRRKETADEAAPEVSVVAAPAPPEEPRVVAPAPEKPVEKAAPLKAAEATLVEKSTPVTADAAEKPAAKPKAPKEPAIEAVAVAAPVAAPVETPAPVAAAAPVATEPSAAPSEVKPAKQAPVMHDMKHPESTYPGRAKILGRVELPAPTAAPRREEYNSGRPARPADQGGGRPYENRNAPRPADAGGAPQRPSGPSSRPGGPSDRPASARPSGPSDRPASSRPSGPSDRPPSSRPSGPSDRPASSRPSGPSDRPGGPSARPGGPPRPGGPSSRPGGPPSRPGAPPRPGASAPSASEVFGAKDQRGVKKKKGKGGDYGVTDGGPAAAAARAKGRREVFEPERGDKQRKQRKSAKPAPRKTEVTVSKAIKRIIRISDAITVGELAKRMGVKANDLIKELMRQGTMVTINHPLDYETAALLATDFHYEVENVAFDEDLILDTAGLKAAEDEKPEDQLPRPPVVTIMGHVDHGKTSLLDAIRSANVTAGEAGGITQHIGAYDVELNGRKITFLDTPGHEAFTAMRARGAKVTDIVVLVVAADDGVMPQTKEAINHAKAAGVPIVVAINKMDKPDANPDRVKQELTEFGLLCEEWGGETIFCEVSAKQRTNIESLLEMLLLQADVLDLKANPNKRARGTIVEARIDRGRGPVATVLVQEGTLKIGDPVVSGTHYGRVRTMIDDRGNRVEAAGPSFPVEVTGLSGVPGAGDTFHAVEDEKTAKEIAQHREQKVRASELAKSSKISLEQLYARLQQGEAKELKVIIKGDVQGSVEAVKDSLLKLSTSACRLVVLHTGVGGIIESDITLASASDAIILGFNVRPEAKSSVLAESEGVDVRLYTIIYDAVADIRNAMEGLLAPTLREKAMGRVEIRETFVITKVGTIAGCYVLEGKITRNSQVRLVRDNVVVYTGKLSSLKRFKDDAREVTHGYECGLGLDNYNDLRVGDILESYEMEAVKTLL